MTKAKLESFCSFMDYHFELKVNWANTGKWSLGRSLLGRPFCSTTSSWAGGY